MANDISVLLGVEGAAAYNKEMQSIISQTKLLDSEMKLVASAFAKGEVSEKKSAQTKAVLEKQIVNQSKRLEELKKVLEAAKQQYGENSTETQKWQIEVNKAEAALNKMNVQLKQTDSDILQAEIEKARDSLDELHDKAEQADDDLNDLSNSANSFSGSKFASALSGVGNVAKAVGKGVGVVALNTGKVLADGAVKLAKFAAVGTGAIAAGMAAGIKKSIELEAEFEQVSDGAKLLFGGAYDYIAGKAEGAYKTVQMSQSEYLTAVNGYAVGLREAMGGTEEAGQAAAVLADKIITAQADIVSATGKDANAVATAFAGVMRGQYQTLDNLGLGIKGTQAGMQEVIDKVNDWKAANGDATRYVMGNYADMESALIDYVEMQGLSGYASKEAMHTIEGSLKSTKSAWKNTLTALTSNNGNLKKSIKDLSESAIAFTRNITPRVSQALSGFGEIVEGIAPIVAKELPALLKELIPQATNVARNLVNSVKTSLPTLTKEVVPELISGAKTVVNSLLDVLPDLIDVASDLIGGFIDSILADENMGSIVDSAIQIVGILGSGLIENAGKLADAGFELVGVLANKLFSLENTRKMTDAAINLVVLLASSMSTDNGKTAAEIGAACGRIVSSVVSAITNGENAGKLLKAGAEIVFQLAKGMVIAPLTAIEEALISTFERTRGMTRKEAEEYAKKVIGGTLRDGKILNDAKDATQEIIDQEIAVFEDAQDDFYQSSKDDIIAVADGARSEKGRVGSAVNEIKNTFYGMKISSSTTRSWMEDALQGMIDGLNSKQKRYALQSAVRGVANTVYTDLHFSRPDTGPLRDYEKWMPDFMAGLAKGIEQNRYRVENAINSVAAGMAITVKSGAAANRTTNMGGVNVYVYGAAGQDVNSLADEVMNRINNAVTEKGAVWA